MPEPKIIFALVLFALGFLASGICWIVAAGEVDYPGRFYWERLRTRSLYGVLISAILFSVTFILGT
jgi:hypothetical protein